MIVLTASERETLRHAALDYLVERSRFFFDATAMARALQKRGYVDFAIDTENVRAELDLLEEVELVKSKVDELGSTKYYAAAAKGILAEERRKAGL